jgi:hypothetical protein
MLLQHADDLFLTELALLHLPSPFGNGLQLRSGTSEGARSFPMSYWTSSWVDPSPEPLLPTARRFFDVSGC